MKTLGEILTQYMNENNLSLRDFAEKANISHTYVGKLQKGLDPRTNKPIEPTLDVIEKVAKAMNMTLQELLKSIGKIPSYSDSEYTIALHDNRGYDEELPEEARKEIDDFIEFVRQKYGKKE